MPYFQYNTIIVGPITIQVWGLLVSLGITAGVMLMAYLARKYILSKELALDLAIWTVIGGFLGARLFHIFFYNLDYYLIYPSEVIKFWHGGASSLGGFFGAFVAVWLFSKKRHLAWKDLAAYADIGSVSLWLGWGIGRIGCFLIHDHPGTLSHFMLAVKFPNGPRHDLGLYESIVGFILFAITMLIFKRCVKKQWGVVTAFSWMLYAIIRFCLDFLRATDLPESDARYASLTPAQWGMIVVTFIALTFIIKFAKLKPPKAIA